MPEPIKIEEVKERVILVGVSEQDGDDAEDSVAELAELVKTAGAVTVGTLIQKRELIHPGTYVGTGKVQEIADMIAELGATGIVCDDELSPAQLKNLEQMLDTKVMDRTLIILDIFAARATTSEGKIQVELAQLKYRLSRLTGLGRSMSRLGGGIGTRGPGEKKLEMDRRLIKDRIAQLNRELKEVRKHREITRAQREKKQIPVAAIVGYTNAGKSTLFNRLVREKAYAADQLFATLDTTARRCWVSDEQTVVLSDTVGFIRGLPHQLVEAFKSTLDETVHADILLHVVDSASTVREEQMASVATVLKQIGADDIRQIVVYNKCDLSGLEPAVQRNADGTVRSVTMSAATGDGLDLLREVLAQEAAKVREENASVPREPEFWEDQRPSAKSDDEALKELEALL